MLRQTTINLLNNYSLIRSHIWFNILTFLLLTSMYLYKICNYEYVFAMKLIVGSVLLIFIGFCGVFFLLCFACHCSMSCAQCCLPLCIVHSRQPLLFSLTFIYRVDLNDHRLRQSHLKAVIHILELRHLFSYK